MKTIALKILFVLLVCAFAPFVLYRVARKAARERVWAGRIFIGPEAKR